MKLKANCFCTTSTLVVHNDQVQSTLAVNFYVNGNHWQKFMCLLASSVKGLCDVMGHAMIYLSKIIG